MADALPAASVSKWTGLYRSVDPFALAPGAMSVADNVVIPGPSLLQPRRGFKGYGATSGHYDRFGYFTGYAFLFTNSTNALVSFYPSTGAFTTISRGVSTFALGQTTLSAYNPS